MIADGEEGVSKRSVRVIQIPIYWILIHLYRTISRHWQPMGNSTMLSGRCLMERRYTYKIYASEEAEHNLRTDRHKSTMGDGKKAVLVWKVRASRLLVHSIFTYTNGTPGGPATNALY